MLRNDARPRYGDNVAWEKRFLYGADQNLFPALTESVGENAVGILDAYDQGGGSQVSGPKNPLLTASRSWVRKTSVPTSIWLGVTRAAARTDLRGTTL